MCAGSQEAKLRALGCSFTSVSRDYGSDFVVLRIPRRVRGPKREVIRRIVWQFIAFLGHRPRVLCGRSGRVLCGVRVYADV